ncbi:hypothetical protein [Sideroxydans lithotrophicus]|uniref:Uncharacterized protein n=1 Tax=Sideroxydans lithotrophicus (strain ES-1) TaxID=580332 RepID=D5CLX2_SIDLE|nr:hypothetical protein [Sideroxydans lithotrophicus]ADE12567.1 hypothetical protein Slit_2340 [Sideroxydans lithotrophicus ES-1]
MSEADTSILKQLKLSFLGNEIHTNDVVTRTASCVTEAERMVEAARDLNATTTKFAV